MKTTCQRVHRTFCGLAKWRQNIDEQSANVGISRSYLNFVSTALHYPLAYTLRFLCTVRATSHRPIPTWPTDLSFLHRFAMPGRTPSRSLGGFASRSKPIAPRSRVPQALQHSPSISSRSFSSTSCSYKPLETQGNAAPGPSFTTINADEISHFSRLSSEWWNTKGEFGLLHRMNPPRVEYIRQKLVDSERQEDEWSFETRFQDREKESKRGVGKWLAGKRCLDVGCGGGLLSEVSPLRGTS